MFQVVWKSAKMPQNTFLAFPDVKKYLVSGGLEVCANASKHVFYHSKRSKIYFFRKKVSGGLDVFANASKHILTHSRLSQISFLKQSFWWSGSMRKCIKTRFQPLQMLKNIFFEKKFLVV
jgi:hypothetical protein